MMNTSDFMIENGVLRRYNGPGGDVVIPEGVIAIGNFAFSGCEGLTSVVIPDGVQEINSYAFSGCTSLPSVVIPEGVIAIGDSAFRGCESLASVAIPNSLKEIGYYAFSGCTSLTSVVIPEGVIAIGDSAFRGCESLASVAIPNSVKKIGSYAFSGCTSLTSVEIAPEHPRFYVENGLVISRKERSVILAPGGLTSAVIPEGVIAIGYSAFSDCEGLTSVTIPEGVKQIGGSAFSGCTSLTSVVIPEGVKGIGGSAFSGCTSLTSVVIPESVTWIGQEAFSGCTGLASITIPTSVAEIGPYAFQGCTGLTSLTLSEGIAVIDRCAFEGCTGLTGITIPAGVTEIGCSAFSDCTALREVTFLGMPSMLYQEVFSGADANLVLHTPDTLITQLPSGYKQAAARDFAKRYISGAELPEAYRADCLKYIKGQKKKLYPLALRFPALLHVMLAEQIVPKGDIPDLTDQAVAVGNAESTAMLLEYQSKQITPEERQALEAEKIQREMDFMLTGTLTVAEAKKSWRYEKDLEGNLCILGYKGREAEIYVPAVIGKNPVTAIDNYAFSPNASHLTEALRTVRREIRAIYLPEGIIQIGRGAFEGCEKLERIHIPANVRKIGSCSMVGRTITRKLTTDNPFAACPSLRELTVDEENQYYLLRDGLLLKRSKKGEVLLGCMEPIQGVCVIPEGTKKIPPECFLDCVDMTGVSLPKRLEKIGTASFSGCKSLTEIHIPDHVTTIDAGAFYGCTSLTNVSIPGSVTKIDGWAFYGCKHLTIHAPAGSYAQQYAEANGYPFVAC